MKNKIFFRLNIVWQIISLFFLFIAIISIYAVIKALSSKQYLGLCMALPFVVTMFLFVQCEHNCIIFKEKYIYVPDDWLFSREKIQYKTIIKYDEVEEINIVKDCQNSLGKKINRKFIMPFEFLEFRCKNGYVQRIFISYYTKKQRVKILKEVEKRIIGDI